MAGDLNKVILLGRLTRDPEIQQTSQGTSYCRFAVALNRYFMQNNEKKEEVSFINCVAWGRQAEVIAQYCQRGKQLGIEGRLKQNTWQDKEGQNRSALDVIVENVQLLGGGKNTDMSSSEPIAPSSEVHSPKADQAPANNLDDDIPF